MKAIDDFGSEMIKVSEFIFSKGALQTMLGYWQWLSLAGSNAA